MSLFETVKWDLWAWRGVPFRDHAVFRGIDLNGAGFFAQIRDRPGGGVVCATLSSVDNADDEGIFVQIYVAEDGVTPISKVNVQIDEDTIRGFPLPPEADQVFPFAWGAHMLPFGGDPPVFAGGRKFMAFDGTFNLRPGVPQ